MKRFIASGKLSAVALVLMAGTVIAPHTASAQEPSEMRVSLSYYKSAPAEKIYADFERQATRACKEGAVRLISLRSAEAKCVADVLDKAVTKLNRADVAVLHQGGMAQIASR